MEKDFLICIFTQTRFRKTLHLRKMSNEEQFGWLNLFLVEPLTSNQGQNKTSGCQIESEVWKKSNGSFFPSVKLNIAQVFKFLQDHFIFSCLTQSKYLILITSLIHKIPKNPSRTYFFFLQPNVLISNQ